MPIHPSKISTRPPAPVVTGDRRCRVCDYRLRGLPADGTCPECGHPVRIPRSIDDPISSMPPDVVRRFRTGGWLAAFSAPAMMMTVPVAWSVEEPWPGLYAGVFTALSVVWVVAVCLLTPAVDVPQAASYGFTSRGRLRRVARGLQPAWFAVGACVFALRAAPLLPKGVQATMQVALTVSLAAGVAGIVVLAITLERLAHWVRDDTAERAFNWVMWGAPVVLVLSGLGVPGTILIWSLLVGALTLTTALALPVGLWSLGRSIHYAVIHAEDHRERADRRRERDEERAREVARTVARMDEARGEG